jgi:sugar phosphate isomerase/epimerase
MPTKIGLIPGIIKDELAADRHATLQQVAALGYQGIEGNIPDDLDPAAYREQLDQLGLEFITVGGTKQTLEEKIDDMIAKGKALGARQVTTWWGPVESKEQVLEDAKFYNEIGKKVADAGLKFCYHNHDHELLTRYDGKAALELLLEATEPGHVWLEADVAWLQYGGVDPVQYLKDHAGRIAVIHLKDIATMEERAKFTAIGTGEVDIDAVLQQANAMDLEWAVVEQDRPHNLSPMESITASILNLKEHGWR